MYIFLPPREKANLSVTLANEKDDILGHASFFDHPVGDTVDQAHWELFLQKHFSAQNCTVCIDHDLIYSEDTAKTLLLDQGIQKVTCFLTFSLSTRCSSTFLWRGYALPQQVQRR